MKAKELAAQLTENPEYQVVFSLFKPDWSKCRVGLRRFGIQVNDIGYSDKLVILGPTEEL